MALSARDEDGQGSFPASAVAVAVSDSNSSSLSSIDAEVAACEREIVLVEENIQRVEGALEGKADFMGMSGLPDRVALQRCLDALKREKSRQRQKEGQLRAQRRQGILSATASSKYTADVVQLLLTTRYQYQYNSQYSATYSWL